MSWKHRVIESLDGDGDTLFTIVESFTIDGVEYEKPVHLSESSIEELEQTVKRLEEAIKEYKQSL